MLMRAVFWKLIGTFLILVTVAICIAITLNSKSESAPFPWLRMTCLAGIFAPTFVYFFRLCNEGIVPTKNPRR